MTPGFCLWCCCGFSRSYPEIGSEVPNIGFACKSKGHYFVPHVTDLMARSFRKVLATKVIPGTAIALIAGAIVLAVVCFWPLPGMARDLFAAHMLQHLLVMNVAAVLIAAALRSAKHGVLGLPLVTVAQFMALWFWHMPAIFAVVHHNAVLQGLMQVSLFGTALLFWRAILLPRDHSVWHRIFALLITAKIFCLLGAVYVFSRRILYPAFGHPNIWGLTALEDQQLAGLLMVSSCALIYVAAAIALFARWLFTIGSGAAFATK